MHGLLVPLVASLLSSQCFHELKLRASDAAEGDRFGAALAIDGDLAVVGAFLKNGPDEGLVHAGAAYVFRHDGETWREEQKLVASSPGPNDEFGADVGIGDGVIVVGAPGDDLDGASNLGAVYVFRLDRGAWVEERKLSPDGGRGGDRFGESVAVDGVTILASARLDDERDFNAGAAYVFRHDGVAWRQKQRLVALDAGFNDHFGSAVALRDGVAWIGARNVADQTGAAYVFRLQDGRWMQTQKLTGAETGPGSRFGSEISTWGDVAIVGAPATTGSGLAGGVHVFRSDGDRWVEETRLTAADGGPGDTFGLCADVSQDTILVGSTLDGEAAPGAGAAYVYAFDGVGWIEGAKLGAADAGPGHLFGRDVAISDGRAVVGAVGDASGGFAAGAAYVLDCRCTADVDGDGVVDDGDLASVVADWGRERSPADVDGSGLVDVGDLIRVILSWGPC